MPIHNNTDPLIEQFPISTECS